MNKTSLSTRILKFIASLNTHLKFAINSEITPAAERITDGTLFLCPPDHEHQDDGLLIVHWQGDSGRTSLIAGPQIAELEIIQYAKHRVSIGEVKSEKDEVKRMFDHFEFKTGVRLPLYQ